MTSASLSASNVSRMHSLLFKYLVRLLEWPPSLSFQELTGDDDEVLGFSVGGAAPSSSRIVPLVSPMEFFARQEYEPKSFFSRSRTRSLIRLLYIALGMLDTVDSYLELETMI